MAPKKKTQDLFCNKFYATVEETAANTLTFEEIQTNINIFDKTAWVLERLEWYIPSASYYELAAAGDIIQAALTTSNQMDDLGLDDAAVIDMLEAKATIYGTAESANIQHHPIIRSFSQMSGGGLIIAPRPLYIAIMGTSLANPVSAQVRGYFRQVQMSPDEYIELIDFYRILS
jgi:hypothetical protein